MNTYSHVLMTWAAARRLRPQRPRTALMAAAGAGLPDLPYLARAARPVTSKRGLTKHEVLEKLDYFNEPDWTPDLALHSLVLIAPLYGAAGALPTPASREGVRALALGWVGHNLVDLATHASDARPHLWPVSRRRWRSPLSYWERPSHAVPVLIAEHLALLAIAAHVGYRRVPRNYYRRGRRTPLQRLGDLTSLMTTFVEHPRQVGALVPTSRRTVREMLDMTDWRHVKRVVELGAGTGVYTAQLLERVGRDARVLAFEIDGRLARRLGERFTDQRLRVVDQSAETLADHLGGEQVDVIVSALPFTTLPEPVRKAVYDAIASALRPNGVMLAIQYSTVRQRDFERMFSEVDRRLAVHNMPPAMLYACRGPVNGATARS